MLRSVIRSALKQRIVMVVAALCLTAFGLDAARKLSVDAFPDVTNIQVQIATEARGRSPEEVERFVTVPLEIAMTGLPGLEEMRSLKQAGPVADHAGIHGRHGCLFCPPARDGTADRCNRPPAAGSRADPGARFHRAWGRSINTPWSSRMTEPRSSARRS